MNDSTGARMNSGMFAAPGYVSSFMMFLRPSAAGCSSPAADAVRTVAVLHPRRDLALGEREQRDADHVDREDDEHLHDASQRTTTRTSPAA